MFFDIRPISPKILIQMCFKKCLVKVERKLPSSRASADRRQIDFDEEKNINTSNTSFALFSSQIHISFLQIIC